ncbi:MAG: dihydrofolate reductase [Actinomycetia bacterium]|nr:dihydrofolate reductase [Actinomycetes bacterium]
MPEQPSSRVTLIAAVARNGVIGANGDMPWRIPEDFAFFKRTTMGHPLVMGRATFDSIGRPLPGRRSIVITRSRAWQHEGVEVAHSLDDALALAADGDGGEEIFVAGGGQIYRAAMERADRLLITEVELEPEGEVTFPEIDPGSWIEVSRVRGGTRGNWPGPEYSFIELVRRAR